MRPCHEARTTDRDNRRQPATIHLCCRPGPALACIYAEKPAARMLTSAHTVRRPRMSARRRLKASRETATEGDCRRSCHTPVRTSLPRKNTHCPAGGRQNVRMQTLRAAATARRTAALAVRRALSGVGRAPGGLGRVRGARGEGVSAGGAPFRRRHIWHRRAWSAPFSRRLSFIGIGKAAAPVTTEHGAAPGNAPAESSHSHVPPDPARR